MQNEWSINAVLQDLGLLVTAIGGILSIVKSLFRKPHPTPQAGPRLTQGVAQQEDHHKINWAWLSAGLAFFGLCVVFIGLEIFSEKVPLVVVGSGNVASFLTERVPEFDKLRPVMIDVGSGAGFDLVLQAAEFGDNSLGAKNADDIVALSSAGDKIFEEGMDKAAKALGRDSAWLSIHIADPPLALMYRKPEEEKEISLIPKINTYGVGLYNFRYVSCDELKLFYGSGKSEVIRAINELTTGTRKNIDEACEWPSDFLTNILKGNDASNDKGLHPIHFLEDLSTSGLYTDLRSWAPVLASSGRAATCQDLRNRHLQMAGICKSCTGPASLKRATFVVVVKLKHDEKSNRYSIATQSACKLAQALSPKISRCELKVEDATWGTKRNGYQLARISSMEMWNTEIPDLLDSAKCP